MNQIKVLNSIINEANDRLKELVEINKEKIEYWMDYKPIICDLTFQKHI